METPSSLASLTGPHIEGSADGPATSGRPRTSATRLELLTVLRFPAALWVLLFHLQNRAPVAPAAPLRHFLENGALAMSFFFVLSGTMLAFGYRDLRLRSPDMGDFYRSRFARIVPAYAVIHVLALFWFTPASVGSAVTWLYVNLLSAAGVQAWFPHTMIYGANGGTWSISVELFFYALFPMLLATLIHARERFGSGRLFVYAWLAVALAGFSEYVLGGGLVYYVLPSARLPEFVLGVLVGLTLTERAGGRVSRGTVALAAIGAVLVSLVPVTKIGAWTIANVVVVPAFAGLIYTVARFEQQRGFDRSGHGARLLIYLGESSYCLFLSHLVPMMALDSSAGRAWKLSVLKSYGISGVWILVIAASLLGAILLHEAVEKPARRALLRRWRNQALAAQAASAPILEPTTTRS